MNEIQAAAFRLNTKDGRRLLAKGCESSGTLLAACSAHDADPKKQVSLIRLLIANGVGLQETDKNGVTPLHRAVRFRSPAAVKELIAHGADVNAVDRRSHSTPLHRAVTHSGAPATAGKVDQAEEIIRLRLANGANVTLRNKSGKTPVDYVKHEPLLTHLSSHE